MSLRFAGALASGMAHDASGGKNLQARTVSALSAPCGRLNRRLGRRGALNLVKLSERSVHQVNPLLAPSLPVTGLQVSEERRRNPASLTHFP